MTPTEAIVWARRNDRKPERHSIYQAAIVLADEVERLQKIRTRLETRLRDAEISLRNSVPNTDIGMF